MRGIVSKGTVIEVIPGVAVTAPLSGTVLFAGPWRSYGPLIIIGGICQTTALVAGSIDLRLSTGVSVQRDEAIGCAMDGGTDAKSIVYVELRQRNVAVDPDR
ncbi:peptidoglycan DD-metalloendopeptidase family protein [Leptospira interrogans]